MSKMNRTYRFVTKTRYGWLRVLLLFVAFTIEYWICLGPDYARDLFTGNFSNTLYRFICAYLGYIFMQTIFVFRGHSQKVYLRFELGLSLLIKCVAIDVVYTFMFAATGFTANPGNLIWAIIMLCICNEITIVVVLEIINIITRYRNQKPEKILYVYEKDAVSEKKIDGYEAVYLVDIPAQERNDWLKLCFEKDMTVYTTAKLSDILIRTSGIAQDHDKPVFYCTKFGIGAGTAIIKRAFDICASCFALLVLWPIMLITAIAIKLEDGGPVLYSQIRCTKDLKQFRIYKFRSMITDSEAKSGARLSCEDDERVTKVGRFIRDWKIDELPQLINILKGDMSVVGPRPERPELIEENCKLVPEFVLRTKVKAGLTGYAQVRGEYETDKLDKLKWDLMYIENYSFLLDLKIIIITAINIVKSKLK